MTVAEVARCFQRLYPRLRPATIPRLRGWRSWNERGRKPAAAFGMTVGGGEMGGYGGPPDRSRDRFRRAPAKSRSLAAAGMTVAEVATWFQPPGPPLRPAPEPPL